MDYKEYLKSILSDKQIKELNLGLQEGKPIIIKGQQGPTGKSTLKCILKEKGYKVYEQHEIIELELNKIIEDPIPNIKLKIK